MELGAVSSHGCLSDHKASEIPVTKLMILLCHVISFAFLYIFSVYISQYHSNYVTIVKRPSGGERSLRCLRFLVLV